MNRAPRFSSSGATLLAGCGLLLIAASALGRGQERDTSFLVPGKTTFQEVEEHWRDGSLFEDPDHEFDTDIYREKPHIYFSSHLHLEPVPLPPDGLYSTELVVSAEEAAKWTRISVRVFEYCRFLSTCSDARNIVLVFTKDKDGKPERLLYYCVFLLHGLEPGEEEVNWEKVLREQGTAPQDVEYEYVEHSEDEDEHRLYRFRRFPKRGIGYVWNRTEAEAWGQPSEVAEKIHYEARIHFEPSDK